MDSIILEVTSRNDCFKNMIRGKSYITEIGRPRRMRDKTCYGIPSYSGGTCFGPRSNTMMRQTDRIRHLTIPVTYETQ